MREYPDFHLILDDTSSNKVSIDYIEIMPNEEKKIKDEDEAIDDEQDIDQLSEEEPFRILVFKIKPEEELLFNLIFSPSGTRNYKFELPFFLSYTGTLKRLRKLVSATSVTPILELSTNNIDFKKVVVNQGDKNQCGKMEIILSNNSSSDLQFRLESKDLDKSVYEYSNKGTIYSFNKYFLRINFRPIEALEYKGTLLLFIDGKSDPLFEITVKGEGILPRLIFDKHEIIMPIVPLNIEAKSKLTIINQGYDNIELKSRFNCDTNLIKIKVEWPDGNQLGITKQKIFV